MQNLELHIKYPNLLRVKGVSPDIFETGATYTSLFESCIILLIMPVSLNHDRFSSKSFYKINYNRFGTLLIYLITFSKLPFATTPFDAGVANRFSLPKCLFPVKNNFGTIVVIAPLSRLL